jgi:hypothetical protein
MKMALQIAGTTVIDNSRNLVNTSVDGARITSGTIATARLSGTYPISISGNAATASNGGVTSVNGLTGAVTVEAGGAPTDVDAIGTYRICYYGISSGLGTHSRVNNIGAGATISGSSLRVFSVSTANNTTADTGILFAVRSSGTDVFPTSNTTTLTGTWRVMVATTWVRRILSTDGKSSFFTWYPFLVIRVA